MLLRFALLTTSGNRVMLMLVVKFLKMLTILFPRSKMATSLMLMKTPISTVSVLVLSCPKKYVQRNGRASLMSPLAYGILSGVSDMPSFQIIHKKLQTGPAESVTPVIIM